MHTHVYSKKYTYGTITTLFILSPDQKQSTYASSKMDKLFGCYKLNSQKKWKKKKTTWAHKSTEGTQHNLEHNTSYNCIYKNSIVEDKTN